MWPDLDNTPLKAKQLLSGQTVFDFINNPERTLLQKLAMETGCRAISGIDMFIGQGFASQEHWFPGLILGTDGLLNQKINVRALRSFLFSVLAEHEISGNRIHHVESAVS
jgi:shikimate 5-dehydrogenase